MCLPGIICERCDASIFTGDDRGPWLAKVPARCLSRGSRAGWGNIAAIE